MDIEGGERTGGCLNDECGAFELSACLMKAGETVATSTEGAGYKRGETGNNGCGSVRGSGKGHCGGIGKGLMEMRVHV